MSHREGILRTALTLFNHKGVGVTTTNHIAAEAGVSPGNLYFHFRDKGEILAVLFAEMVADLREVWRFALPPVGLSEPAEFLGATSDVSWRFRFFHREMYALRRHDSALAKAWRQHVRESIAAFDTALTEWSERGLIPAFASADERREVVGQTIVMLSHFLQFHEAAERIASRENVRDGVAMVVRSLHRR